MLEQVRQSAYKQSAIGLIESADMYYTKNMNETIGNSIKFTFSNGEQTSEEKLSYKGKISGNGEVNLYKDGKTSMCIDNGYYYATKSVYEDKVKSGRGICSEYNEDDGNYEIADLVSNEALENLKNELLEANNKIDIANDKINLLTRNISIGGVSDWKKQLEEHDRNQSFLIYPNERYLYNTILDVTEYKYLVLVFRKYLHYNSSITIGLTNNSNSTLNDLKNETIKQTLSWTGKYNNADEVGLIYIDVTSLEGEYYPFIYYESDMYTGYYYYYLTKDDIPVIN